MTDKPHPEQRLRQWVYSEQEMDQFELRTIVAWMLGVVDGQRAIIRSERRRADVAESTLAHVRRNRA